MKAQTLKRNCGGDCHWQDRSVMHPHAAIRYAQISNQSAVPDDFNQLSNLESQCMIFSASC
jgi:hypothetical protein